MSGPPSYAVVIPTTGRPALATLLCALDAAAGPAPREVVLVDDRPDPDAGASLPGLVPPGLAARTMVVATRGRGPAAARNAGWRAAGAPWVAFLDDDVVPTARWCADLADDLAALASATGVAGSQGRIVVPLPRDRRPTDWERNVAGLSHAVWATADLAYRRSALVAVGGFDERFPRAYREDSDLGLRLARRGLAIVAGRRTVVHPVGTADRWVSVRKQAGNADDALMQALHGRAWRAEAGAPPGRMRRHAAIVAAATIGAAAMVARRPQVAAAAGALAVAGVAELAWTRIAPGPRNRAEVLTMVATSAVLPPAAVGHRGAGIVRSRRLVRHAPGPRPAPPAAVLVDRDGTLVHDVPYNGDPRLVLPLPGVRRSLDRLRRLGVPVAIVSNQSGVARGLITAAQLRAVNDRVAELLGPFDDVRCCPHAPQDGCGCRKPAAGLLLAAAERLGVEPVRCAMVGDIGADMDAARSAGMRGVLVPTAVTQGAEVRAAPECVPSFAAAVDLLMGAPA